jgi:hypothetical protein
MFRAGDTVERDLDGLWFEAEVRDVHLPPSRAQQRALDEQQQQQQQPRRRRRIAHYDLFYPDTQNNELGVPEDEVRLKVSGLVAGSGGGAPDSGSARSSGITRGEAPALGGRGVVLVGDDCDGSGGSGGGGESKYQRLEESKSDGAYLPQGGAASAAEVAHDATAVLDPFGATHAPHPEEGGHVTVHNVDDNERFQSTGTAYLTHGHVGQDRKAAGGGGLRAIRLLRK